MTEPITPAFAEQTQGWVHGLDSLTGGLITDALLWATLFVGVGLLLAMALTLFLAKKRLLQRQHRGWNIAAKLAYVVVILGLLLMMGAFGGGYGAQRGLNRVLYEEALPAFEAQMPAIRSQMTSQLTSYHPNKLVTVGELVEPWVKEMYYVPTSDGFWERNKAKWINDVILRQGVKFFIESLQNLLITKLQQLRLAIGGTGSLNQAKNHRLDQFTVDFVLQFTQNTAKEVKFDELDKTLPSLFFDAFIKHLNSFFTALYVTLGLVSLFLALIVVAEMVIYRRFYRQGLVEPLPTVLPIVSNPTNLERRPPPTTPQDDGIPVSSSRRSLNLVKEGARVFFGSWFMLIAMAIGLILVSQFFAGHRVEGVGGWLLIGFAIALGVVVSPVVLLIYVALRRWFYPAGRIGAFLLAFASSLVPVPYLMLKLGNPGGLTFGLIVLIVVWLMLFAPCLVALRFIVGTAASQ